MSVYIKGMEMPTSCGYCPLRYETRDGDECYLGASLTEYQKRPDDCPLIPVPEHGRLIDADAAVVAIQNSIEVVHDGMQKILLDYAQKMFNATPTIIPADKEVEG